MLVGDKKTLPENARLQLALAAAYKPQPNNELALSLIEQLRKDPGFEKLDKAFSLLVAA